MDPFVRRVYPVADFALEVEFETGERRPFDMTPYLHRGVFDRLQDCSVFRSARVVDGSVEWPGGIDLSYDTLYLEGQPCTEKST
ncbi:MAG: DUF2442 domain-containing protein [Chromatiales bacterium]|nr:DUF2442 domain-containing protein [Chromatiales bacterium]